MSPVLRLLAPAKLNLFLHVTGRRADGYHELQTLFQLLDYGDELTFRHRDDAVIRLLTDLPGVDHDNNLIVRAAKLLQTHTGSSGGVDIECLKRIPQGGGLGGGSSDAATTLLGLNRLWDCHLPIHELAALGLQLGADVPVFVSGKTAWGEGIGERLTPVAIPPCHYLVVMPQCPVSTAEIFKSEQLTRNSPRITIAAFLEGGGRNDCQPVVAKRYPAVQKTLDWLSQWAPCQLTGTGSAVFAAFPDEKEARRVLANLPASFGETRVSGFVAMGINQSPALSTPS